MKATDLRIGNLVLYQGENILTVDGVFSDEILTLENVYQSILDFDTIPLTEEWLLKFGFKKWGDKYTFGLKGINIHHRKRGFVLRKSVPIIKYVHQLQNLYFALTGKELTLLK